MSQDLRDSNKVSKSLPFPHAVYTAPEAGTREPSAGMGPLKLLSTKDGKNQVLTRD